jgi:isopentenyl-diphosphate Delta-isomerase
LMTNQLVKELGADRACNEIIISGGVTDFLDGYYLTQKSDLPAVYGQASALLRHARGKYEDLYEYVEAQVEGLQLANSYLTVK